MRNIPAATPAECVMYHLEGSGPCTVASIENFLVEQCIGVGENNVGAVAASAIKDLLEKKQIEQYGDDTPPAYDIA